jgi:multiple sugar transport system substrate-binding protein
VCSWIAILAFTQKENEMYQQKISRREMLKLTGTVLAGSILAACGTANVATVAPTATQGPAPATPTPKPPAAGHVTVMHDVKNNEFSEDMRLQFEAKYPSITVEMIQVDLTTFFANYAAGNPPDLVRVQAPSIPPYLARKMLYDLTPYFQSSAILHLDDLASANNYYKAEDPLHVGTGKIYGMCKDWSPDFTLFAYKKAFADKGLDLPSETKPMTYQEVYDLGKKLATFDGDRITMFGFDYPDGWVDRMWMNILAETGDSLFTSDFNKIVLTGNDKTKAVVQYFFNHDKDTLGAVSSIIPSPSWIGDDFDKGLVGLILYGYWFSGMAESDITKDQVLMLPAPTWTGVRRDPTMTATGMIMAASTKVPDAAWKVFEWYNGEEPAIARAGSGWGVPALKSNYSKMPNQGWQAQVQTVLKAELDLNTAPLQFNPYLNETTVSNAWFQYLQQALAGQISFDQMLANIENDVNSAIQDGKSSID